MKCNFSQIIDFGAKLDSSIRTAASVYATISASSYRMLHQGHIMDRRIPSPYEPGLAASLHDLSRRLSEASDAAGARAAIEEAILMRRRLARYGAHYAGGLANSLELRTSIEMAAPVSLKTSNAMR
jgi:hypothetical protein